MEDIPYPAAAGEDAGRTMVRRVGVVDVGSNSVRLVVFDGVARAPAYFYNEKILCGLGKGLAESGRLNAEGVTRALRAIRRFTALGRLMRLNSLVGVATAAVREARDGEGFCDRVLEETGLDLRIASGAEEGELSAKGVLLGWPRATGLVCDIGGASMELARLEEGRIGPRATAPLGPLRLADIAGRKAQEAAIQKGIKALGKAVPGTARRIFLVGGSWRAIAKLDMERRAYPLRVLHEYRIPAAGIAETCDWIGRTPAAELEKLTDTSSARMELVPYAARVLPRLVAAYGAETVSVSSYGLREGILYDLMPPALRARDPLIEAARHMERSRARFPGFGDALFEWMAPVRAGASPEELRLIHAACLLHDISWRTHPDYRAEICFEMVTRANLSGLDHAGRVFLGLAIMHRYKSRGASRFDPAVAGLLDADRQKAAETLGRALRLGAMLTGAAPGALENTTLAVAGEELVLSLPGETAALGGEAVERRLAALAARLGLSPRLVTGTEAEGR